MSDPKKPTAKIVAGASLLQVLKERKKRFLNNFFVVSTGKARRKNVSKKPVPKFIKEADDFLF